MIEIICNGDDEKKDTIKNNNVKDRSNSTVVNVRKDVRSSMKKDKFNNQGNRKPSEETKNQERVADGNNTGFHMPKNIRQIGDISSNKKIYIEDYAFTYINSIAYGNPDEEQAGVLLGECQRNSNERCIFIKGVIKAKNPEDDRQGIYFDEKMWSHIYSDIDKYFPNLQVVGWFVAMPDITLERKQFIKKLHLDNFAGSLKTMFLINTTEKEENFYLYENNDLREQKGYVCFYERNYEMQEYMLQKRGVKSTEEPESDRVVKSIRRVIEQKEERKQKQKNSSFVYSLATLAVVVLLVIGINTFNNYDKMKNLSNSISDIQKRIDNSQDINVNGTEKATTSDDTIPVNKVNGEVYPTKEDSQSVDNKETASPVNEEPSTENKPVSEEPQYRLYTVKAGDTVLKISKREYGNTSMYNTIVEINGLTDPDKLYEGQQIKLP